NRGGAGRFSLSPLSYLGVERGSVIVLPSPNGATLCLQTGEVPTFTACLRNAAAVAGAAVQMGRRITVVAAGERWPSGALRPALEDWLGAGAVVARMAARRSPEAAAAEMAFGAARTRMVATLVELQSGKELIERGYEGDVRCAADLDATRRAPILVDGTFMAVDP
ncbi:MAG: 2-phosphosulfolactate phosphatase, partial [Myxococcota bacterium]